MSSPIIEEKKFWRLESTCFRKTATPKLKLAKIFSLSLSLFWDRVDQPCFKLMEIILPLPEAGIKGMCYFLCVLKHGFIYSMLAMSLLTSLHGHEPTNLTTGLRTALNFCPSQVYLLSEWRAVLQPLLYRAGHNLCWAALQQLSCMSAPFLWDRVLLESSNWPWTYYVHGLACSPPKCWGNRWVAPRPV